MKSINQFTRPQLRVLQALLRERNDDATLLSDIREQLIIAKAILVGPTSFVLPDDIREMILPYRDTDFS
jgi:hypothetical protein